MALPSTELEWVDYLSRRHDAEKPELEALDRYYEGTQPVAYMHPEIFREVADRIAPVIIAWPQLVVDSVEERLDVEGFGLPDEDGADKDLWRVWQSNDLDETSQQGHLDALVMRRAYACVGSDGDDANTPLVTVESPLEVFADLDPRTRKVRAALRRVMEEDSVARLSERYATLYLPNRTVWYTWRDGWVEEQRDEHELGLPPVVPLTNRARLRPSRRSPITGGVRLTYGVSELAPVIPLSDAACKLATDMMVAAEGVALPLRGLWGVGPGDLQDQHGNPLTAIQAIMSRLLTIPAVPDAEGKEFQFTAASLANFHESISQLAKLVASIAGLPPHYLGYATDNPASADAIRSAESRLVKRAERKQRGFGGSWELVMRLVRRIQEGDWDPRLKQLETKWRNASTPTEAQAADAATKLYTTSPRPIVPLRQTRERLGFSQVQIERMESEDEREAARDPLAEVARGLAAGTGEGEMPEGGMRQPPMPADADA